MKNSIDPLYTMYICMITSMYGIVIIVDSFCCGMLTYNIAFKNLSSNWIILLVGLIMIIMFSVFVLIKEWKRYNNSVKNGDYLD